MSELEPAKPGALNLPDPDKNDALLRQAASEYHNSDRPAFVDVSTTDQRNAIGGKEYELVLKPVPDFMLVAKSLPDVNAPQAAAFIRQVKTHGFGITGTDLNGEGWNYGTAVLDGVSFPEIHNLLKGEKGDQKWGLKTVSQPARAIAEGIHGRHLPATYPVWVSQKLKAAGDAVLWVYDGKHNIKEMEKAVIHVLGMSYNTGRIHLGIPTAVAYDESVATAIQAFTWCNVLREFVALMRLKPHLVKFRFVPLSGDKDVGPLADAMPRISWDALYAGFRLLPDVEQELLLNSGIAFEMCLPTEEECCKYTRACQDFLGKIEALPVDVPATQAGPANEASKVAWDALQEYQRKRRAMATPPYRPKPWCSFCICTKRQRPAKPALPPQVAQV